MIKEIETADVFSISSNQKIFIFLKCLIEFQFHSKFKGKITA